MSHLPQLPTALKEFCIRFFDAVFARPPTEVLYITQAHQMLSFIFWVRVTLLMYGRCLVLSFDLSFTLLIFVTGEKGD